MPALLGSEVRSLRPAERERDRERGKKILPPSNRNLSCRLSPTHTPYLHPSVCWCEQLVWLRSSWFNGSGEHRTRETIGMADQTGRSGGPQRQRKTKKAIEPNPKPCCSRKPYGYFVAEPLSSWGSRTCFLWALERACCLSPDTFSFLHPHCASLLIFFFRPPLSAMTF